MDLSYLQDVDPIAVAMLMALGAGIAQLVKNAWEKDWKAVTTIAACSVGLGIAAELATPIPFLAGVLIGLQAAGVIAGVSQIGKARSSVQVDKANTVTTMEATDEVATKRVRK